MARYIILPLLIAIYAVASTSAFTSSINPSSSTTSSRAPTPSTAAAKTKTSANLVPEQGRQLVAFSQDYLSKRAKESAHRASNLTNPRNRQNHHPRSHESSSPSSSNAHRRPGIVAGLVTRLLGQRDHQGKGRMMMVVENHLVENDPKYSPYESGADHDEEE